MKILSGTQFQWIAYNIATREFFGTGGGNYKTVDGHYTEEISYFSRDNSRVGARLQFDFKLQDGDITRKNFNLSDSEIGMEDFHLFKYDEKIEKLNIILI